MQAGQRGEREPLMTSGSNHFFGSGPVTTRAIAEPRRFSRRERLARTANEKDKRPLQTARPRVNHRWPLGLSLAFAVSG
jgi:hypothetical protein